MAFGQAAGPPASAKDLARLAELVEQAGYGSFKEARHPLGLTQRQAAGKFTREEAAELAMRLEAEGGPEGDGGDATPIETPAASGAASRRARRDQELALAGTRDEALVAELELRGWTCIPPLSR